MTDTANQATGLADAAQAMEGLLDGLDEAETGTPSNPQTDESKQPGSQEQGDQPSDEDQETTDDAGADEAEDGADGSEDEGDAEDEEQEEGSEERPVTVTVTIDGKTEEVTLEEVAKGYQRHADYSRKTQKLAEDRKAFETEQTSVVQERSQYAHLLGALKEKLDQLTPQEPDWQKLRDEDPIEYLRLKDLWRDHQDQVAAVDAERQRVAGLNAGEQAKAIQQKVQESQQKLHEYEPAWKDAKKWSADREKIKAYGAKLGFSAEELAQAYDHRAIVAIHKAMKYDELMANKPKPVLRKGAKPMQPSSAARTVRSVSAQTRAKQRLAKTGSVADAAVVFEGLLDG